MHNYYICAYIFNMPLLIFMLCLLNGSFGQDDVPERSCGNKPADLVYLLDESGSIYGDDFKQQLTFVKELTGVFDISEGKTHVGVITFDHAVRPQIALGEYHTKSDFDRAIDQIRQHRGSTNIARGIQFMREAYFQSARARNDVPKIGIVITDGSSDTAAETIRQADLSRRAGITLFAIGVGSRWGRPTISVEELRGIANKPTEDYMFTVGNYDLLRTLKQKLSIKACEVTTLPPPTTKRPTTTPVPTTTPKPTTTPEPTTTPKPTTTPPPQMIEGCRGSQPLDVVFSLPDQIGVVGTESCINFINTVSEGANISPKLVQVGISKQFFDPRNEVDLKDIKNQQSLRLRTSRMRLDNVHLEQVIRHIRTVSFSEEHGARNNSIKFAVIMTNNYLADLQSTRVEANKLKEVAKLIMVGISKRVSGPTLQSLASVPRYALRVSSWEELYSERRITDALKTFLCDGAANI